MASRATRRIVIACIGIVAASIAQADWGNAHYCTLSESRFVIFASSQRFVLRHGAAWELVDPSQKSAFDKWLAQGKLTADLGQLVSSAPIELAYPLAGEVDVTVGSDATTALAFAIGGASSVNLKLSSVSAGAQLDTDAAAKYAKIATSLGKSPSTLLVLLSEASGKISDIQAWGAVRDLAAKKPERFVYLDRKHGVLWIRANLPSPPASNSNDKEIPTKTVKPSPKEPTDAIPVWLYPTIAAGMLLTLIVGFIVGRRGTTQKQVVAAPAEPPAEIKLLANARAEVDSLRFQVEQLQSYRQFSTDHDSFQRQIDSAVEAANRSRADASDMARKLEHAQSQISSLTANLASLKASSSLAETDLASAESLISDLTTWANYVSDRLDTLMEQMKDE